MFCVPRAHTLAGKGDCLFLGLQSWEELGACWEGQGALLLLFCPFSEGTSGSVWWVVHLMAGASSHVKTPGIMLKTSSLCWLPLPQVGADVCEREESPVLCYSALSRAPLPEGFYSVLENENCYFWACCNPTEEWHLFWSLSRYCSNSKTEKWLGQLK